MSLERVTNHAELAVNALITQYKQMPKMVSLITALCGPVQRIEDVIAALGNGTRLATADGVQLDDLGALVGIDRNGLDDAQYRLIIRGTIAANWGVGTIYSLQTIVGQLFGASQVTILGPLTGGIAGTISIGVGSPTVPAALFALVQSIVRRSIPAGVTLLQITQFDTEDGFRLAGPGSGLGLGDLYDLKVGGKLADLVL